MSPSRKRALLVIDVQNEYVNGLVKIEFPPLDTSLPRIAAAMDAAVQTDVPVVVVQHAEVPGAPVFQRDSDMWQLHPTVAERAASAALHLHKSVPSCFVDTGLEAWLVENAVDTLVVAGYMTNNCDQATTNHAVALGYDVEFLSDATGAIPLSNEGGSQTARQVHESLLTVLQSNFAAVLTTDAWIDALRTGSEPPRSNPVASLMAAHGAD